MTYSDKATAYLKELTPEDRARLEPLLQMFAEEAPQAGVEYYHPNILFFVLGGCQALGISPRKNYISLYMGSLETMRIFREALPKLGKTNNGVGCIRFKKLSDLNLDVLRTAFRRMGEAQHHEGYGFQTV